MHQLTYASVYRHDQFACSANKEPFTDSNTEWYQVLDDNIKLPYLIAFKTAAFIQKYDSKNISQIYMQSCCI